MSGNKCDFIYRKGFIPIKEAREDQKYFDDNASTGERLDWKNRDGDTVIFSTN